MGSARHWPVVAASGILAFCTVSVSAAEHSACVGDSPVGVTRWVVKNRAQLVAPDSSRFITADLLASIRRDNARSAAREEICGICGGDLWTNSQEGYARPPASFRQSLLSGDRAEVTYSMRFSIDETGPSEPRSARIVLRKEQACWKIDDIVHGNVSIKRIISGIK
jgi:hypothetical protein